MVLVSRWSLHQGSSKHINFSKLYLRWLGTVWVEQNVPKNLLFMAQAVRKWNNIRGSPCSISQKMGLNIAIFDLKGEVRTINDRNICERRSCMKNNGKSPTFKIVSGEERRPSEVRRVSLGWRLPGASHSSADLTWSPKMTGNPGSGAVRAGKRRAWAWSCCSDLDKQVSDEICRNSEKTIWDPISSLGRVMPPSDFVLDSPGRLSCKRRRTDRKDFYHVPQHHKP